MAWKSDWVTFRLNKLVICGACAVSDKTGFADESFPRRCHRDDEMGAETTMAKNLHAGMGVSRWVSKWETVSRKHVVETTEKIWHATVSLMLSLIGKRVSWTSVVLICPAFISPSSGNKAQIVMNQEELSNPLPGKPE